MAEMTTAPTVSVPAWVFDQPSIRISTRVSGPCFSGGGSLPVSPTSTSPGNRRAHAGSVIIEPIAIIRPKSWIGPTCATPCSAANPAASVRIAHVIGHASSSIVCRSAAMRSTPLRRTSR